MDHSWCNFPHDIHPGTRERQEHRYTGEPIDYYSIVHENRRNMHGITTVETEEADLDEIETYQEIIDNRDPPVRGYPESYVQRMGLAEHRVLVVHVNSYAYHHSRQRVREELRSIFSKALQCMVDFICGDFNQFANRQFSRETGGSIFGGIVLEVLEDAIRALNQQLWRENWITFNISSSSAPLYTQLGGHFFRYSNSLVASPVFQAANCLSGRPCAWKSLRELDGKEGVATNGFGFL